MDATANHYRARVASLSRSRAADDPELVGARRDLKAARLAEHVAKVVAAAPPLTYEQRARISVLLVADRPQAAHADLGLPDPTEQIGGEV
ncbi:hypothetical protein [Gordonia sp. MP11Mi]|uniref:Uncharacterized protein n=1 Tax=Gordonia sp. MP11Mi TaxID=3022769 RepID=A0AA97GUF2_9ACTN